MANAGLAWLIAVFAGALAFSLLAALRKRNAALAELSAERDAAHEQAETLRVQLARDEGRTSERSEALQTLRRKLDKARKRAAHAKDELAPASERIGELEATLRRRDDALRSLRSERAAREPVAAVPIAQSLTGLPKQAPSESTEPIVAASPAVDDAALRALEVRAERAEARAARADARAEEAGQVRAALEQNITRQQVRIRNQDTLYLSLRSELDVKNDRLRQQREELERLLALKVAVVDSPDAAAPASEADSVPAAPEASGQTLPPGGPGGPGVSGA